MWSTCYHVRALVEAFINVLVVSRWLKGSNVSNVTAVTHCIQPRRANHRQEFCRFPHTDSVVLELFHSGLLHSHLGTFLSETSTLTSSNKSSIGHWVYLPTCDEPVQSRHRLQVQILCKVLSVIKQEISSVVHWANRVIGSLLVVTQVVVFCSVRADTKAPNF